MCGVRKVVVARWQIEGKMKGTAGIDIAVHPQGPAHEGSELLADRQPQTGAAVLSTVRTVCLLETIKNQFNLVRRNADTGISDAEKQGSFSLNDSVCCRFYSDD